MQSETVLGIDFGTTNSVCAVLSGGDPEVLENAEGDRVTPSVVYYTKDAEQNRPLVGQSALNKAEDNPERVIASIKRDMGEEEFVEVDEEQYRVEDIAADIIRKVRTDAAEKLGVDRDTLTKAVITTPAYWESDRKQAVIQAAEMAGFESIRTIKEPASAAIAYGRFEPGLDKTIGVYDLGGGTFDFAIVDVDIGRDNGSGEYNVQTQSGHPQLGGDDWDDRIVEWIVSEFEQETGVNPLEEYYTDDEPFAHKVREERIRHKAREAKEELSNRSTREVDIRIPFFMDIDGESVDIDTTLSQTRFEAMTEDLLEKTVDPIYTALDDADMDVHGIDDVILVGGSTRMPQVKELVKSVFNQEPKERVNPDEAVAAGAAIKANRDDILLLEVTPLSLGIGINGDRFKRMIDRNERLPARTTEVFTTSNKGATAVRIPIYQGERDIASENRHLKTLIIQGMTPGSRNSAHIEVTFEVQQNGLINVQAVESTRNKSVGVEIEGENRLPDKYINEKVEEARDMEEMDRRRQKVIEAQNEAKEAIKQAEELLRGFDHVFDDEEREHMEKHVTNVRQIRKDNTATLGSLREATENLNEWVLEIGDRVRQTGAHVNTGPSAGPDVDPADVKKDQTGSPGAETDIPGQVVADSEATTPTGNKTTKSSGSTTEIGGMDKKGDESSTTDTSNAEFDVTTDTGSPSDTAPRTKSTGDSSQGAGSEPHQSEPNPEKDEATPNERSATNVEGTPPPNDLNGGNKGNTDSDSQESDSTSSTDSEETVEDGVNSGENRVGDDDANGDGDIHMPDEDDDSFNPERGEEVDESSGEEVIDMPSSNDGSVGDDLDEDILDSISEDHDETDSSIESTDESFMEEGSGESVTADENTSDGDDGTDMGEFSQEPMSDSSDSESGVTSGDSSGESRDQQRTDSKPLSPGPSEENPPSNTVDGESEINADESKNNAEDRDLNTEETEQPASGEGNNRKESENGYDSDSSDDRPVLGEDPGDKLEPDKSNVEGESDNDDEDDVEDMDIVDFG